MNQAVQVGDCGIGVSLGLSERIYYPDHKLRIVRPLHAVQGARTWHFPYYHDNFDSISEGLCHWVTGDISHLVLDSLHIFFSSSRVYSPLARLNDLRQIVLAGLAVPTLYGCISPPIS